MLMMVLTTILAADKNPCVCPPVADPDSADPIARESTRVAGTIVKSAQSSIDPAVISKWGMGADIVHHEMVQDSVGFIGKWTTRLLAS